MKTVELPIFKAYSQMRISPLAMSFAKEEDMARGLFFRLEAIFATEKQDDYVLPFPASWWDMFKERYFPKWALCKWPAKQKEVKIPITLIYTTLKTKLPYDSIGPRICIAINDSVFASRYSDTPLTDREFLQASHDYAVSRSLWQETTQCCPVCRKPFGQ